MADQNTSLPIRSEADGTDERLHVKIVDGTNPAVNQVAVDSDSNLHVEIHGNDPAGVDRVVRTSELGALTPDGIYDASDNTKPGNIGLVANSRSASPDDTTQTERLTSIEDSGGTVRALDISLHDEAGEAYSDANPLAVYIANDPGTEIHDYDTSAAVAANATDDHIYAVANGTTLELHQVIGSASGKLKMEVQYTLNGSDYTTLGVMFNSTASTNMDFALSRPAIIVGSATTSIRIRRTNRDNQPQDVYSTIVGILK